MVGGGGGAWKDRQGGRRDRGPVNKTAGGGGHPPGGMDVLPCEPLREKPAAL